MPCQLGGGRSRQLVESRELFECPLPAVAFVARPAPAAWPGSWAAPSASQVATRRGRCDAGEVRHLGQEAANLDVRILSRLSLRKSFRMSFARRGCWCSTARRNRCAPAAVPCRASRRSASERRPTICARSDTLLVNGWIWSDGRVCSDSDDQQCLPEVLRRGRVVTSSAGPSARGERGDDCCRRRGAPAPQSLLTIAQGQAGRGRARPRCS